MDWKPLMSMLPAEIPTDLGSWHQLAADDIEELVTALAGWYPGITIGGESHHLDPNYYINDNYLEGGNAEKENYPVVLKSEGGIQALIVIRRNLAAKTVTSPMGACAPKMRGNKIGSIGPRILESFGRAIGAELAYYFSTLMILQPQLAAERAGYKLCGIVPAHDIELVPRLGDKRLFEAIYAKILCDRDRVLPPSLGELTDNTKSLWTTLFGEDYGAYT